MVYYYRNLLGRDTIYNDEGHLDIAANAEAVRNNGKAEKEALSPDKTELLGESELPGAGVQGTEEKTRKWWVWVLVAIATITGWGYLKKKVEQIESGDLNA